MNPIGRMARTLALAAILTACGGPATRVELEPLPETDLAAFEPNVRDQLAAASTALEEARGGDDGALADAYGELGRRLHAYELYEAASVAYRNALRLAPGEFRWLYYQGILNQVTGELEEASRLLGQALAQRPEDLPTRLRLAEIGIAQGDLAAARTTLETALELDTDCALAHFFLGNVAVAGGDPEEAVGHYRRALELQPRASAVHSPLAVAYRSLGETELAESHLARRGRQPVRLTDPLALELAQLNAGAVAHIRRGARAQIEGDLRLALDEYRQAVAADPENPEARQSLASALAQLGETEAAIAEYRAALALTGDNALVLANLGGLLIGTAAREEGVRHLERALELDPSLAKARLARGQVHLWEGRFELAEEQYRQVLERDASSAPARLGLARSLAARGRTSAATTELEAALERDPPPGEAATIHQELAALAAAGGDRQEALARLDRALELDPQSEDARFARANLLGILGRYDEAAQDYTRFLARRPASVNARLGQATALAMAGDLTGAARQLEEGLARTDGEPVLAHALARLLLTAPDPAARDPQRGLELARQTLDRLGTPEAGATFALALAAVGRCDESIERERSLLAACRRQGNDALAARLGRRLDHFAATGECLAPWS